MGRSEQEIFDELAKLCTSPGYVHAAAFLCFRDNTVGIGDELTPKDFERRATLPERLSRTELAAVIGLMAKGDIDYVMPSPETLKQYLDRTDALLGDMHSTMAHAAFDWKKNATEGVNPFKNGAAMREPIFYSGESAYTFQYRDFAVPKYRLDNPWLLANKGFTVEAACDITKAITTLLGDKLLACIMAMRDKHPDEWTVLPGHTFTPSEVAALSGLPSETVERFVAAFSHSVTARNKTFNTLHDFNAVNAFPLLPVGDGSYVLLQIYSLTEALYETPFYWMYEDKVYTDTALAHRGRFAEEFTRGRLEAVFGKAHAFSNVEVHEKKGTRLGEIDVLISFADRAIVVQAKSKRLTLKARQGDDDQIKTDFQKAIQNAYDQGYSCATALNDPRYRLTHPDGTEMSFAQSFKEIFVLCVVSDHYPALSFQARNFLTTNASDVIRPPFVLDVFSLDAIAEMLASPLRFLSYLHQRTMFADKVMASHELTVLGYHLTQNLWFGDEHDMVMLNDDFSTNLDIAMVVRREGIPGCDIPDGVLTRLTNTTLGRVLTDIEAKADPMTIEFGFTLLTLAEDSFKGASEAIDKIASLALRDGKGHDFTMGLGRGDTGFTVHCNRHPFSEAGPVLHRHCKRRKYSERARSWSGICLDPATKSVRFGLQLDYPWTPNAEMEELTKNAAPPMSIADALRSAGKKVGVGRNEPCPCGSGRKYKKCCLPQ